MAQKNPLISIVIPTHNNFEILKKVITALSHQSQDCNSYEVIVVDDASSKKITKEYFRNNSVLPLRLKITHKKHQSGDKLSRDKGVSLARGDLIVLLDSDMVPDFHFIEAHSHAHENASGELAITGNCKHPAELGRWVYGYRSSRNKEKRLLRFNSEIPIRLGATTANMSLSKKNYESARLLTNQRISRHPEWQSTYHLWGWKDIEFMTALSLMGVNHHFSKDAIIWHYCDDDINKRIRKVIVHGIGAMRYACLYPEMREVVLNKAELEMTAGYAPLPSMEKIQLANQVRLLLPRIQYRLTAPIHDFLFDFSLRTYVALGRAGASVKMYHEIETLDPFSLPALHNFWQKVAQKQK